MATNKSKNYVFRPSSTTPDEVLDFIAESVQTTSFPKFVEDLCQQAMANGGRIIEKNESTQPAVSYDFNGLKNDIVSEVDAKLEKHVENIVENIRTEELISKIDNIKLPENKADCDESAIKDFSKRLDEMKEMLEDTAKFSSPSSDADAETAKILKDLKTTLEELNNTELLEKLDSIIEMLKANENTSSVSTDNSNVDNNSQIIVDNKIDTVLDRQDKLAELIINYFDNMTDRDENQFKYLSNTISKAVTDGIAKYVEQQQRRSAENGNGSYQHQQYQTSSIPPRIRPNAPIHQNTDNIQDKKKISDTSPIPSFQPQQAHGIQTPHIQHSNTTLDKAEQTNQEEIKFAKQLGEELSKDDLELFLGTEVKTQAVLSSEVKEPKQQVEQRKDTYDIDGFSFDVKNKKETKKEPTAEDLTDDDFAFISAMLGEDTDLMPKDPFKDDTQMAKEEIDDIVADIVNF